MATGETFLLKQFLNWRSVALAVLVVQNASVVDSRQRNPTNTVASAQAETRTIFLFESGRARCRYWENA